jgi:hypothetical protein
MHPFEAHSVGVYLAQDMGDLLNVVFGFAFFILVGGGRHRPQGLGLGVEPGETSADARIDSDQFHYRQPLVIADIYEVLTGSSDDRSNRGIGGLP